MKDKVLHRLNIWIGSNIKFINLKLFDIEDIVTIQLNFCM